mgnify:FL=1
MTSSNNDTQTIYTQLRQMNLNLNDSQNKYGQELEQLRSENKQLIVIFFKRKTKQRKLVFFVLLDELRWRIIKTSSNNHSITT